MGQEAREQVTRLVGVVETRAEKDRIGGGNRLGTGIGRSGPSDRSGGSLVEPDHPGLGEGGRQRGRDGRRHGELDLSGSDTETRESRECHTTRSPGGAADHDDSASTLLRAVRAGQRPVPQQLGRDQIRLGHVVRPDAR